MSELIARQETMHVQISQGNLEDALRDLTGHILRPRKDIAKHYQERDAASPF